MNNSKTISLTSNRICPSDRIFTTDGTITQAICNGATPLTANDQLKLACWIGRPSIISELTQAAIGSAQLLKNDLPTLDPALQYEAPKREIAHINTDKIPMKFSSEERSSSNFDERQVDCVVESVSFAEINSLNDNISKKDQLDVAMMRLKMGTDNSKHATILQKQKELEVTPPASSVMDSYLTSMEALKVRLERKHPDPLAPRPSFWDIKLFNFKGWDIQFAYVLIGGGLLCFFMGTISYLILKNYFNEKTLTSTTVWGANLTINLYPKFAFALIEAGVASPSSKGDKTLVLSEEFVSKIVDKSANLGGLWILYKALKTIVKLKFKR